MDLSRRSFLVYALLALVWALVLAWQAQEHYRVKAQAQSSLRNRSLDIASTLGAFIRGLQFRGAVFGDRLQPVLDEMVSGLPNEFSRSGEVLSVALLNAAGEPVAFSGAELSLEQSELLQRGERWGRHTLTIVYPVEGVNVPDHGATNAPILLPPLTNTMRDGQRSFRREARAGDTNRPNDSITNPPPWGPREGRPMFSGRPSRPFWARGMQDEDYQALIQKRELHGLVLAMSTQHSRSIVQNDFRTRLVIALFATLAVFGASLAWRNLAKSSDLQIRLVRASEMNSHLRELNVAAAGLAHETRNPLNIIRGLAQMISKEPEKADEAQIKARDIIHEADKVAAQLNEFINYSRPREVRRTVLQLSAVVAEVVRALKYDLEEKKIKLRVTGDQFSIEADEQLLRQALFNLLLNATQAVGAAGEIEIEAQRNGPSGAVIEIRDDGPGVPPDQRAEIFKPYFTTTRQGTGLGLAVVQQIVLAHGWDIQCLPNQPKGAIFRLTHLKLAS